MNLKLLTAAAVLTIAAAAPALAHDHMARSTSIRHDRMHVYYYGSGYWPGDAAPRIPRSALETAGAKALFAYDPYAYYDAVLHGGYRHCWGSVFIGTNRWRTC
ncbi:MAG: hypothetical protein HY852_23555 [Bradyrhizobium sp.]|uniref:hypothetical protein n=1 Tax=Bradyrhizobium sp. TaxID=376 RepID=UPI0025C174AE|nr:hypothetical protein [Bradyrhizobium sp.]MBI5264783.1 hypothetical protein [Bradyrhizobium sp.]